MEGFMNNEVGLTAGDVYQKLTAKGQLSMSRLKKEVNQNDVLVAMAVGWLAREGKIKLSRDRNTLTVALNGN
jgi:hypothetical protein